MASARRADERDAGFGAGARQRGIFGEEAVTGMQRVAAGAARDVHHFVDAQIAFAGRRGADGISLVGKADVQRGAVDFAENGDGRNAHFAAGAHDAHGDFTAIGDEDFFKHGPPPPPVFLRKSAEATYGKGVAGFGAQKRDERVRKYLKTLGCDFGRVNERTGMKVKVLLQGLKPLTWRR